MTGNLAFTDGEMAVDDGLGYPKAYAKLCKDSTFSPYSLSPPFTFLPFAPQQVSRVKEFDEMFPIVDPNAKPSVKPKIFVSLLWNQLNYLGNAGFDPDMFRVDPYGNVLYYHADSASPLAWDIDHWFPISRGGLTVPRNLRILQWQVCKKKNNQLEFLIPWWDLQVGISINQFLSIFASSNSDFRHMAFSWLFSQGESEELSNSHNFPQHFIESSKIGLAPAAVVLGRRESRDTSSILKSLDINTKSRSCIPTIASKKVKSDLKENEESKVSVEELELTLMKKRWDADKCRRLAEAQSSYKVMLEKMIRDAMHQSVVYKEQMRSNQAANNSLMARLEAQRAICNSAEKEVHCKYKQRDKLEKQIIRPECEHTRKRSRMDDFLVDNKKNYLTQSQMEMNDDTEELEERGKAVVVEKEENQVEERVQNLEMEGGMAYKFRFPVFDESEKEEEDEESRKQRGKGNVEKWLQMLLEENNEEEIEKVGRTDEIIHKLNLKYPHLAQKK